MDGQDYIPYVMRAQARKNLQKIVPLIPLDADTFNFSVFLTWLEKSSPYRQYEKGNLARMISDVARTIADDGQANLEAAAAASEADMPSGDALRALAGAVAEPKPKAQAVTLTLEDIKQFRPTKLHGARSVRSLDWALDDTEIDDTLPSTKSLYVHYAKALEALTEAPKKQKRGDTKEPLPIIAELRRICNSFGIKFEETRTKDMCNLVAAVKARCDAKEE